MTRPLLFPIPGNEHLAVSIADATDVEIGEIEIRQFPDGETYLRFVTEVTGRSVILLCSLAKPDSLAIPLLFAADATRDLGAVSVALVAPYLAYMRQDRRFKPGEAVTSRTFARLLSDSFDWLVTVDPHLHRYASLGAIYSIPTRVVHSAPSVACWIEANVPNPVVVGPDIESEQWVKSVAGLIDAPHFVLTKTRTGDREVSVALPDIAAYAGRRPVVLDDIGSSGQTLVAATRCLELAGFAPACCMVVHALFDRNVRDIFAGQTLKIVSTDTVPHETNAIALGSALAAAIADLRASINRQHRAAS
jgi:ribose-phosphate pyrophosphokinase